MHNGRFTTVSQGHNKPQTVVEGSSNSNSNSTFIALNLYLLTDSKTHKAKNQRS